MQPPMRPSYHGGNLRHNQEKIFPWENEAVQLLKIYKPKCIVLDLDFTLWPTFYSAHTLPPYIPLNDRPSQVLCVDKSTHKPRMLSLYPEVQHTIQFCLDHDILISIASKNSNREGAQAILRSLGLWHQLHFPQIYHNRKSYHFRNLKSITHFNYDDFMFFDDDIRNVTVCQNMGVHSYRVDRGSGFNGKILLKGLRDCVLKMQSKQMVSTADFDKQHDSFHVKSVENQGFLNSQPLSPKILNRTVNGGGDHEDTDYEDDMELPEKIPGFTREVISTSSSSSEESDADEPYCMYA